MKKTIIMLFTSTLLFSGCKKKESTSVVVNVPTISMEVLGPQVVSTTVGSSFVDNYGANFHNENGGIDFISAPTSSNLDLNTPGFYSITYKAKTKYGYVAKASRLVLVTSVSPLIDHSGTYARTSNGQTVTVTKVGTGLYTTDNVGGVAGIPDFIFDVYFGLINDSTIVVPSQPNLAGGGDLTCSDGKLTVSGPTTTFKWIVLGSGFGTATRTFVK